MLREDCLLVKLAATGKNALEQSVGDTDCRRVSASGFYTSAEGCGIVEVMLEWSNQFFAVKLLSRLDLLPP